MTRIAAVSAAIVCATAAGRAQAANPDCRDTTQFPNPIYVAGSSAIKPFIIEMAKELSKGANPITLIYASKGSCVGVEAIALDQKLPASTLTAYTLAAPTGVSCDTATEQTVDIGVSDVFVESCPNTPERPDDVGDFLGPVQAMGFIVPTTNPAQAIVAEEGHFVFGWDDSDGIDTPWTDKNFKFRRKIDSGTQIIIGAAIQVGTAKVKGTETSGSDDMIAKVGAAADTSKTIGFAGIADVEAAQKKSPPAPVKTLAFRSLRQKHAYYPNSTSTSFDRRNVRDGHYTAFGYAHLITKINPATGKATNAKVQSIVDYVLGNPTDPPAPFNLIDVAIKGGLVPQCAMKVTRTRDGGDLKLFAPAAPCDCYFERNVPGNTDVPESCKKDCAADNECGAGKCRLGVCEAR
jgi:ABC-type phosphate transport system substrate-binding protein